MAQAVDLLVDGGVLFDVGIGGGDVGLGLVIIVIRNKILHTAVGKEGLQLGAELGRQSFVVGDDQGRLLHLFDDGCHGEGLAGAGNAQQHLLIHALQHAAGQGIDGLGLVAAGLVGGFQHKFVHTNLHERVFLPIIPHPAFGVKGNIARTCNIGLFKV